MLLEPGGWLVVDHFLPKRQQTRLFKVNILTQILSDQIEGLVFHKCYNKRMLISNLRLLEKVRGLEVILSMSILGVQLSSFMVRD